MNTLNNSMKYFFIDAVKYLLIIYIMISIHVYLMLGIIQSQAYIQVKGETK